MNVRSGRGQVFDDAQGRGEVLNSRDFPSAFRIADTLESGGPRGVGLVFCIADNALGSVGLGGVGMGGVGMD